MRGNLDALTAHPGTWGRVEGSVFPQQSEGKKTGQQTAQHGKQDRVWERVSKIGQRPTGKNVAQEETQAPGTLPLLEKQMENLP